MKPDFRVLAQTSLKVKYCGVFFFVVVVFGFSWWWCSVFMVGVFHVCGGSVLFSWCSIYMVFCFRGGCVQFPSVLFLWLCIRANLLPDKDRLARPHLHWPGQTSTGPITPLLAWPHLYWPGLTSAGLARPPH